MRGSNRACCNPVETDLIVMRSTGTGRSSWLPVHQSHRDKTGKEGQQPDSRNRRGAAARPEEASRTLLIRTADRQHLSAARQSPLLRVARTPATSTAPPSSPAAEALCYRRWAGGQAPRFRRWPFAPAMTVRILIADGLSGAAFLERHIAPLS